MGFQIALWIIVIVQSVVIVGLMREVGLIQLRIGPAYAMEGEQGLAFGSEAPTFEAVDPDGERFTVGGMRRAPQLLVFLSPSCGVCHELIGPVTVLAKAERKFLDVIAICGAEASDCGEFLRPLRDYARVAVDTDGAMKTGFRVTGSSFALVVDSVGRVGQSGLVNNLQHLEYVLRSLSPATGEIQIAPSDGQAPAPEPANDLEEGSDETDRESDGHPVIAASPYK